MNIQNTPYGQPTEASGNPAPEPGRLERHLLWVNDQRWNWFPLLRLRPPQHDYLDAGVILKFVCFVFLPFSLTGGVFLFFLATEALGLWLEPAVWLGIFGGVTSLAVAVAHQYICFHYWNRRAFRLRRQPDFRPSTVHTQVVAVNTDSPYRPPSSGAVAVAEPTQPPLPLRHVVTLLEAVFVHGTLLAITLALCWSTLPAGVHSLPITWQTAIRLTPLACAVLLAAGLTTLQMATSPGFRWWALILRGVALIALFLIGLLATTVGLLQVDEEMLLLTGIAISLMAVFVLGHILAQLARLLRQDARVNSVSSPPAHEWTGPATTVGEPPW